MRFLGVLLLVAGVSIAIALAFGVWASWLSK